MRKTKLNFKWLGIAMLALALLLLVVLISVPGRETAFAGRAAFVDFDDLPINTIDLVQEETMIFHRLPAEAGTIRFRTAVDLVGAQAEEFTLTLVREDEDSYAFEINQSGSRVIVRDRLDRVGDVTSVYLNPRDAVLDLELRLESNQLSVSNLHFSSPDLFRIAMLHNHTGVNLGRVLRLNASHIFNGKLNTSSPVYPEVEFGLIPMRKGIALTFTDFPGEYSFNNSFSVRAWSTPIASPKRTFNVSVGLLIEPVALLLNVTSNIQGALTSKYLVLAVNNRTLDVNDSSYPQMRVDFTDLDHQGMTAKLNITFRATTDLQPLALPCRLPDTEARLYTNSRASGFLAKSNIAKIYSYDPVSRSPLQSAAGAPVGQINTLKQFEGYFVQLARAEETQVIINNCEVEDPRLVGVRVIPSVLTTPPAPLIHSIKTGWNLFSVPGVVPTSLKEIAPSSARFELFTCTQGEVCNRLDVNTPLQPGRAYWVHSNSEFTVSIE